MHVQWTLYHELSSHTTSNVCKLSDPSFRISSIFPLLYCAIASAFQTHLLCWWGPIRAQRSNQLPQHTYTNTVPKNPGHCTASNLRHRLSMNMRCCLMDNQLTGTFLLQEPLTADHYVLSWPRFHCPLSLKVVHNFVFNENTGCHNCDARSTCVPAPAPTFAKIPILSHMVLDFRFLLYSFHQFLWTHAQSTDRKVRGSNPEGARFSAPVQTGPGAHPASCTMGTGSFLGVKSGRGVTLIPHPLLLPSSRKGRAIPLLSLWAVRPVRSLSAYTRVHFTFTLCSAHSMIWCTILIRT